MPHRSILPTAVGAGLLLAGSLLFSGVAAAATGPNTPECSQAGSALNAATALLNAKKTFDADVTAANAATQSLGIARANVANTATGDPSLAATLADQVTVADRPKVVTRITNINDGKVAGTVAQIQRYLTVDQALLNAIDADTAAQTALTLAKAAYNNLGGDGALANLTAAGGLAPLQAAQASACASPASSTPAPSATATPTTSATTSATTTTSGGSAQTSAGLVYTAPVGGVATGWAA